MLTLFAGTQPLHISNVSTDSTFATVSWEPPQGSKGYVILVSSDGDQSTSYVWSLDIRYTVSNLSPETVYVFQVRPVASSDGPWSKPKVGITLPISRFLCYMRHLYQERHEGSMAHKIPSPESECILYVMLPLCPCLNQYSIRC